MTLIALDFTDFGVYPCPKVTKSNDINSCVINHREKIFFFRYYLSSAVCVYVYMYVAMYVFAITATPFNLELSNFGITFLM